MPAAHPVEAGVESGKVSIAKGQAGRHYDVYLPLPGRGIKPEHRELRCKNIENMEKQGRKAYELVKARNRQLVEAHQLSMAAWKRERDRIMRAILQMWEKLTEQIS